ncbi:hypothetical protein VTK26DRAFT_1207 [Humicola hyalothermophila]
MASETPSEPPNPNRANPITHAAAIGIAILGPIALLTPTRGGAAKSTFQNAVLGASTFWGFNTLAGHYTGKSITQRSSERWGALLGFSSSASGEEKKTEEKKVGAQTGEEGSLPKTGGYYDQLPTERAARNKMLMDAERRRRAEAAGKEYKEKDTRGFLERIWMGGEKEGWRERRLEEERKALEEGKGYGGLIMDQLREVWEGKGEGKEGEEKKEDGKKE